MRRRATNARGFTLIEVMIVVVILGILASIAYPAYQRYVRESRRADAQAYMMELALREERHRATNNAYADHTTLGVTNTAFYTFTIAAATNTYTITAAVVNTSSQRDDTGCLSLTLTQAGTKGPANCWKN